MIIHSSCLAIIIPIYILVIIKLHESIVAVIRDADGEKEGFDTNILGFLSNNS